MTVTSTANLLCIYHLFNCLKHFFYPNKLDNSSNFASKGVMVNTLEHYFKGTWLQEKFSYEELFL